MENSISLEISDLSEERRVDTIEFQPHPTSITEVTMDLQR
jgi:hypothetical protein